MLGRIQLERQGKVHLSRESLALKQSMGLSEGNVSREIGAKS